jgi:glycosyltransferase involved in cell wall biosynthesis
MRVAIVHYWLLNRRGGEAVLEALCRLLPDADLFTLFYDPERVSPAIRARRITASFLNPLRRHYRSLLPLMPMALEHFDLRGYDLVISSESGPAKGVLVPSGARHICYCHTPMRYLWDLYPAYLHEWTHPRWKRALMAPLANYLRLWDYASAARVDDFIANSRNVNRRIWRCYRRESQVIYPPVAVETFHWKMPEDYYLIVSELVPYKRVDIAVRLFSCTGRKLRVVGDGPEYASLKSAARANVEFCGRVSDEQLRDLYARCRAYIMPGEEDFGITPVEALASGKAVIALGRGGVLESAPPGDRLGGILYPDPEERQLEEAIARFERVESLIVPGDLQASVARFSESEFLVRMSGVLSSPTSRPCPSEPRGSCAGEPSDRVSTSGSSPETDPFRGAVRK